MLADQFLILMLEKAQCSPTRVLEGKAHIEDGDDLSLSLADLGITLA